MDRARGLIVKDGFWSNFLLSYITSIGGAMEKMGFSGVCPECDGIFFKLK